jgi:phosphoribosylamine--glycine ligase
MKDDLQDKLDRLLHTKPEGESPAPVRVKVLPPKRRQIDVSADSSKSVQKTPHISDKRLFVIVTEDFSGLGWAKKLQEEGEKVIVAYQMRADEEAPKPFAKVGEGWVKRMPLDKALKDLPSPQTYWIFSENHLTEQAEKLRAAGQNVFGTSTLSEKMEHDREYAITVAKDSGLDIPETKAFSTIEEGLKFLDAHPDLAYVFKPDDSKFNRLTFVPFRERSKEANRETYLYLKHADFTGTYILQERKYGVEVNVEVWFYEGEPFFAFGDLENKRKWAHNLGEMTGCGGDVVFQVPLDGKLVKQTIGKLFPFYKKEKYTGFADVNVIIGDNRVDFLEVCNRFGYNSHPNLFLTLALDGFGDIIADFIDGKTKGMGERFRKGFGASISLNIEHEREGLPLYINDDHLKRFFPFDGYKDGEDLMLTGYSADVGIFTDYDYTLVGAAEAALNKLFYNEAVSYPDMAFRLDLGKSDYAGAPLARYEALRQMGLL